MVRVVFLHPDLGIGGGERAVVDAALALKSKNHDVEIVTSHHNQSRCFHETRDGTLSVTVAGDWLPRNILGRCQALCAYIRMIYAALYLVIFSGKQFDMVFCDQISACIPFLRIKKCKILFYCHFPDLLLTKRESILKRLYRAPIDWLEEKTTAMADSILVNSKFTAGIFKGTFTSLSHMDPQVLYPIPDFSPFNKAADAPPLDLIPPTAKFVFLSINRFERKKNLALAIEALKKLKEKLKSLKDVVLVMAGGYDERLQENREYYMELRVLTEELGLSDHVVFLRSFTDAQKVSLLKYSDCLLYTPDREHFGIVPIEAMYMKCPVIAISSGGPLETVADGETGFLCEQDSNQFAEVMAKFLEKSGLCKSMGEAGHRRVVKVFSFEAFTEQLDHVVTTLC